jgi:hypothetical protein
MQICLMSLSSLMLESVFTQVSTVIQTFSINKKCLSLSTGRPRYMQSFYLQIRVYGIENDPYL